MPNDLDIEQPGLSSTIMIFASVRLTHGRGHMAKNYNFRRIPERLLQAVLDNPYEPSLIIQLKELVSYNSS